MYDRLLEALENEVESEGLQRLPENFYADLRSTLREFRRRIADGAEGKVAEKVLLLQLDRTAQALTRLIETRLRKMIIAGLSRMQLPDGLVAEDEKRLLAAVADLVSARDELVTSLVAAPPPPRELPGAARRPMLLVRFVKDVPLIVGADMRYYGPFKPEDVALLPAQNAEALVRQGAALQVQVE